MVLPEIGDHFVELPFADLRVNDLAREEILVDGKRSELQADHAELSASGGVSDERRHRSQDQPPWRLRNGRDVLRGLIPRKKRRQRDADGAVGDRFRL